MASRAAVSALTTFGVLLIASAAQAEPGAAQKETARSLMAEARGLREHSDLAGALARFREADAIMGVPTTGFEVARTQADLGMLVEARETLHRILAEPTTEDDPEPFRDARKKAEALDEELDGRLASLRLLVVGLAPGTAISIRLDRDEVPEAALALPLRVNPGHHRIVVKAAGQELTREVDTGEHAAIDVELKFAAASASVARAEQPSSPAQGDSRERSQAIPTLAYVGGAVAGAGIVVGSVAGVLALSDKHAAEKGCVADRCPPSTWSDLNGAHTFATVSTIAFIA